MSLILNCCGSCGGNSGGGGTGVSNHEQLNNLLGGDSNGHYHLTPTQWNRMATLLTDENFRKLQDLLDGNGNNNDEFIYDGGAAGTPASDYKYYLDGGGSMDSDGTVVGGGGA